MEEIIPSKNFPEILLVDDTPEDIEFALAVLRDNHFKVRVATKGSAALKLLEQHQPDLILLDVFMPGMNGFTLCKTIKADKKYCHIPVIFLTASNDEDSIKKGFSLGAQDYVVKPYNTSELLARVHTHIKLKQQTESLLLANRDLDSFCYSVSHDLKAPLLSINKLTEYLTADYQDQLGGDGNELIVNIREKSQEVIDIIDHLLELSRMSEMRMNIKTIRLDRLFREVYDELVKLEPPRSITFTVHSLPDIQADPVMIKLLLTNILSNSLKYTRNKQAAVIEVSSCDSGSETVIAVKDNGAGFDMRYAARLFKVFQRLHSESEFKGSGVGLAISGKIIKRHHGKAWITGEVDQGATFYFSLPKQPINAPPFFG